MIAIAIARVSCTRATMINFRANPISLTASLNERFDFDPGLGGFYGMSINCLFALSIQCGIQAYAQNW